MKVTVANPAPQKVTQVADNAIEIEYASAIKDVITAASFKNEDVYYLIDQTKVPFSLISKVETEGNVAARSLLTQLTTWMLLMLMISAS